MNKDRYSSAQIAERDAKNAADALKHLRKAYKCAQGILSNATDISDATDCIYTAIKEMEAYRPYDIDHNTKVV